MLKDKRLLTGLGFGMIIGSILLHLMNLAVTGADQNLFNENRNYTIAELQDIAEGMGYTIHLQSNSVAVSQELIGPSAIVQEENIQISTNEERVSSEKEEEKPTEPIKTVYSVTIKPGMGTDKVSELLLAEDMITDAEAFKKELNNRNLNNKIQIGTFTFTDKPELTDLVNQITNSR